MLGFLAFDNRQANFRWYAVFWAALLLACAGCQPKRPTESSSVDPEPASQSSGADALQQAISAGETRIQLLAAITDDEFAAIELPTDLLELQIDAGSLTDRSLSKLVACKELVHLRLRNCALTDAGMAELASASLDRLRILNIPQATLTAAGIVELQQLPVLAQLRIGGPQIDDRAVEAIVDLPNLQSLHLIGPSITDSALDSLAAAPKLVSLYVDDCHLSDDAWKRLFQAKPNLHVHIDQQHHDRDPAHGHHSQ